MVVEVELFFKRKLNVVMIGVMTLCASLFVLRVYVFTIAVMSNVVSLPNHTFYWAGLFL